MGADAESHVQTWSIYLGEEESCARLASAPVGRLGVIVKGKPEIFPVAHTYDEATGCIVFPTHQGTKLDAALDWPWVAFETDGLDEDAEQGWSVLVVGHAEEVTDADEIARARAGRHVSWGAGSNVHWVRIVPSKVTGREIRAVR